MDKKTPILKVNEKMMRLCNLLEQQNRELRRLRDDVDTINSYIKTLPKYKEDLAPKEQEKVEISKGWFFGS